jgi:hypothetical protein
MIRCKEITENNYEIRMIEDKILTNMKSFNETSTQEIMRIVGGDDGPSEVLSSKGIAPIIIIQIGWTCHPATG